MELTHARLTDVLSYDDETGYFTWIKKTHKNSAHCVPGARAGSKDTDSGYRTLWLDGTCYYEHILVVFYKTGVMPKYPDNEVDHINGIKDDNRWANLRVGTKRENQQNRQEHREGKLNGCCRSFIKKPNGKTYAIFTCKLSIDGVAIHLGNFKSEEECNAVYLVACANRHLFKGDKAKFKKAIRTLAGKPNKETGYFLVKSAGAYKVVLQHNKRKTLIGFFAREKDAIKASRVAKKLKEYCTPENREEYRALVLEELAKAGVRPVRPLGR
jgi:hypothetical protein